MRAPLSAIAAALVAACLTLPSSAAAHAVVTGSSPERGARLPSAPETVEFDFSEPVETDFGAVRVFGPDGTEVQEGEVFHPGNAGAKAAITLKPDLGEGTYTATYRVISADSHPVSGGLTFSVGQSSAGGAGASELLASDEGRPCDRGRLRDRARPALRGAGAVARRPGLPGAPLGPRPGRGRETAHPIGPPPTPGSRPRCASPSPGRAGVGLLMTLLTLGLQAAWRAASRSGPR